MPKQKQSRTKRRRVLLKISGEAMSGVNESGLNKKAIHSIAQEINEAFKAVPVELAIVIGGGNIIRGTKLVKEIGTTPVIADQAGMLATIINGIILQDFLENTYKLDTRLATAIEVNEFAEPYLRRRAMNHLKKGRIVMFAGGTGNPRFTTDTAAVLRAIEIDADVMAKGTKVEGIYNKDPHKNGNAKFMKKISHSEFLKKELGIMDRTAVTLAKENEMDIRVFNILEKGNLKKLLSGEDIGSLITSRI